MAPIKEWFGTYNIIFKWFEEKYGEDAFDKYLEYIAVNCFSDVEEIFRTRGLKGIQDYFDYTFAMDDGKVNSEIKEDRLIYKVTKCPDYEFMNSSDNPNFKPIKNYCRHHEIINSILAKNAGYEYCMTECDGLGQCTWEFKSCSSGKREVSRR